MSVIGFGACGVDFVAKVASFPKPDDKIRACQSFVCGGGNCANTLTALSRLARHSGSSSSSFSASKSKRGVLLVSKLGSDAQGTQCLHDLFRDNVDCDYVTVSADSPTAFTYVVVCNDADANGGSTRTCIHTPVADVSLSELDASLQNGLWADICDNARIVHFDSRHTAAALHLAKAISTANLPHRPMLTIDVEKPRPHQSDLLQFADLVFTNERFPSMIIDEYNSANISQRSPIDGPPQAQQKSHMIQISLEDITVIEQSSQVTTESTEVMETVRRLAMAAAISFPNAQVAITTLGGEGSVLLRIRSLFELRGSSDSTGWITTQTDHESQDLSSLVGLRDLPFDKLPVSVKRFEVTVAGRRLGELDSAVESDEAGSLPDCRSRMEAMWVSAIPAALLPSGVVDTTGAGDAFIGGFLGGLLAQLTFEDSLKLATVVAAMNVSELGARGSPHQDQLLKFASDLIDRQLYTAL